MSHTEAPTDYHERLTGAGAVERCSWLLFANDTPHSLKGALAFNPDLLGAEDEEEGDSVLEDALLLPAINNSINVLTSIQTAFDKIYSKEDWNLNEEFGSCIPSMSENESRVHFPTTLNSICDRVKDREDLLKVSIGHLIEQESDLTSRLQELSRILN